LLISTSTFVIRIGPTAGLWTVAAAPWPTPLAVSLGLE
jgi:hypothetical protein